jgi:hypothetical protein
MEQNKGMGGAINIEQKGVFNISLRLRKPVQPYFLCSS